MYEDQELDANEFRYVLYARKSTTDEAKQVRSIPDQILECQEFARRNGLRLVGKPLTETESAKKPNKRPVFRHMLDDLITGKYDGILSWHPDRLARNMLEGGEVIHLVDEGRIKDLKFVAHPFTNDPGGKMLLGLAFAISKHYSDDLAQKVDRGNRRSFFEGKMWTPKHGYVVREGFYEPDGKNFELIKAAWQKRKKEESIEVISAWLNEHGYFRQVKSSDKKVRMTPQILSDIYRDTFYYGLIIRYGRRVDLGTMYDFKPAVSEEDFNSVQQLSYRKIKPTKPHRVSFYPLRRMVLCSFCQQPMVVGPSTGRLGTRYLNYRCDNQGCSRKKRSLRGFVIFDFISEFLKDGLNLSEKEYHDYVTQLTRLAKARRQTSIAELQRIRGALTATQRQIKEVSEQALKLKPESRVYRHAEEKLATLEENEGGLAQKVEELKQKIVDPKQERLSLEQFLNLSKSAATKVKHGGPVEKDTICRFVFLNLTVDEGKVVNFELKEPFRTLLAERKQRTFSDGGDERT